MTLFKVTTVTLHFLFIMPRQNEGQKQLTDEDFEVLDEGKTLSLNCEFDMMNKYEIENQTASPFDTFHDSHISWKLPDRLETNKLVRKIFCLSI